ncbi:hypothetical protein [Microcystis phage MaeS]|nr:hypothetical protein [Microcystis phage MaeS]
MINVTKKKNRKGIFYFEDDSGEVIMKECSKCHEIKEINQFNKHKQCFRGIRNECKKCVKGYVSNNKEKIRENQRNNKEKTRNRQNKWIRKNREKCKINLLNYRARKEKLLNNLTTEEINEIIKYFSGGCSLTNSNDYHLDHVIPLASSKGGTTYNNIIPLRPDLNSSKNDSNLFEWFAQNKERFNLSQEKFNHLIEYLARINKMTVEEYRDYYYSCFKESKNIITEKEVHYV